jgi:signal peptidase I
VIVFHAPPAANCVAGTGCDFIKRVLGLPGDTVQIKDNGVWINDQKLDEPYIPSSFEILPGAYTKDKVIRLGSDEYFVSGDNRPYSSDSRAWGPITSKEIVGRVFFRYWPPSVVGWISGAKYSTDR